MSDRAFRAFRKHANDAARQAAGYLVGDMQAMHTNEMITRRRVDSLEAILYQSTRWERLKWLLRLS